MIPKVHAFLGLTKSFPRRGQRRAEPESVPEQKRAYELSDQQKDIIQHEPTSPIVVAAAAGSGKTSTLVEYAQAWPDHTFLYLAFNAAIKKEAERVMPRNVTVMTTHGLAYRSLDIRRIARDNLKSNLYRNDIRQAATRISYENSMNSQMLRATTHALKQFLASDDKTVKYEHLLGFEWTTQDKEPPTGALRVIKAVIENLMDFQDGGRPFTHDMYLKCFCSNYTKMDGQYSALMVDEFQDTNPAVIGFLKRLKTPVIGVGDSYQAIYGFRGAVDAMNQFNAPKKHLTRSWRFGEELAETANFILKHTSNPPNYVIEGNPSKNTRIHPGTATQGLILARTNAGLFEHLTNVTSSFYIEGGFQSFRKELEHAIKLFEDDGSYNDSFSPGPLPYKTWDELLLASEDQDPTAVRLDALLNKHQPDELRQHLWRLSSLAKDSPQNAELHLSSAHKAKGLEAPVCSLLSDFSSLRKRHDIKDWLIGDRKWNPEAQVAFDQEIHLLYVAATRAKDHLYVADQDLHFELTRHRLAPPEEKPERRRNDA